MHPQLISSGYDDMRLFKALFERSHYIGEVGLNFSEMGSRFWTEISGWEWRVSD